jgi:hypothetical protein
MINYKIKKRGMNNFELIKQEEDIEKLKLMISKITSSSLKHTRYVFERTKEMEEFFKKTYIRPFFYIFDDAIELRQIRNGQKRVKNYEKKTNSNKVLMNTIERINKDFEEKLKGYRVEAKFLNVNLTKKENELLKIYVKDTFANFTGEISIYFNKRKWNYEIIEANVSRPKTIIPIINKIIYYRTMPTRNYRSANKVIENENNT